MEEAMSDQKPPPGQIRTEVHGRVLKIIIDNPAKKNSFNPQMMVQISDAMTLLDRRRGLCRGQRFYLRPRHAQILRPESRKDRYPG
jgi:hypothetical protein